MAGNDAAQDAPAAEKRENRGRLLIGFSKIAAALCALSVLGAIVMPELWIAFAKGTVQNGIQPFSGAFGCYPDEEPCCMEGYNRTAYTDRWAYPNANITCIYIGYPVKEVLLSSAIIMLVVAFVAFLIGKRDLPASGRDSAGR